MIPSFVPSFAFLSLSLALFEHLLEQASFCWVRASELQDVPEHTGDSKSGLLLESVEQG